MKAEYSLGEAIALVNFIAEEWSVHTGTDPFRKDPFCPQCRAEMSSDNPVLCVVGQQLMKNRAKWKRRCKYAARRAGIKMTV